MVIVIGIILLIIAIFLLRLLGAWMLRIDEVIKALKEISRKLDQR
jgi:uncharacterized membrane protein YbhN (UPF0104 family)